MSRPGDWNCRSCQHLNFQRRDSCQRCGDSKSGVDFGGFGGRGGGGSSFGFMSTGSDVRPGDWYCAAANCGAHNFASRSSCFKCGAFKDDSAAGGGGGGFDSDMPRSRRFRVRTWWRCWRRCPTWMEIWRLDLYQALLMSERDDIIMTSFSFPIPLSC
ncbi:hypothetical protein GBA52_009893 [Prunus armeniaca]|nr:hypothetical protein GBA52_009893 [Prunus armeniaca]